MEYSAATAYSSLGSNKALGSPILNQNFSTDNWNKWEMVVWGVFLSNFTTPFVDDYNSAFNLNSGYGSEGSGVKALQFGSGRDPANTAVIANLLDYAMNQQSTGGSKPIYVGYNEISGGEISVENPFKSGAASNVATPDSSDTTGGDADADEDSTVAGESFEDDSSVRQATVADLFLTGDSSKGTYVKIKGDNLFESDFIDPAGTEYVNLEGIKEGRIPTFAINGSRGTYEVILDYTDAWDLSMVAASVSKAVTSDLKADAMDNLKDMIASPEKYLLVLDSFGNICTSVDGTYRVIIPASANQHLTANPSYNLVNSLIFNANISSAGAEQLVVNGGQHKGTWSNWSGGVNAFSNGMPGIPAGSALLFYDTDTIIAQDAMESGDRTPDINIGEIYKKLFSSDINDYINGKYPFKIEIANAQDIDFGDAKVKSTVNVLTKLINQFSKAPSNKALTSIKTDTGELEMFGSPVAVSVQLHPGHKTGGFGDWISGIFGNNKKYNYNAIHRQFVNYTYQAYKQSIETTTGMVNSNEVRKAFDNSSSHSTLYNNLLINPNLPGTASPLLSSFIARHTEFYKYDNIEKLKTMSVNGSPTVLEGNSEVKMRDEVSSSHGQISATGVGPDGNSPFGRTVIVYPTSEVMRSVANILGVREGTEFAVYSTYIYLTYLDWYGVLNNSITSITNDGNLPHNFNNGIFDGNSDVTKADINQMADNAMTEEQKEQQIKDWTYMLLNPTAGREYRSQMIISGISDWIYDTYQKIVYGDASSYYDTGSGVTSRNSTGFLTVEPYSENFMTAWFLNNYSYFATILIGVFFALTIVIGLLKKQKISWFLTSILVMVNMVLILPATGEVVPLISNNFVQSMFSDKMSYWAISEGVTNATMEADYTNGTLSQGYLSSLTQEEQSQVVNLVKNLNVLYTDRSLNIKQDISKKVTQLATTNYEEVQQLRSARWMLPMIMRQFTADNQSANYVYIPLADVYDDLTNMWLFYKPEDAAFIKTVTAAQTAGVETGASLPEYADNDASGKHNMRTVYFRDYTDTTMGYDPDNMAYKQKSYEQHSDIGANIHTFSYLLNEKNLIAQAIPNYSDYKSYDEWAASWAAQLNNGASTSLMTKEAMIEDVADGYSRFDRGTISEDFSYLWATESPLHYFYQGIKDSLDSDGSVGSLAGDLQGTYVNVLDASGNPTGREVRKTFMHANDTGYVRDILDLEEMFTNMIPYLYGMQLKAEGYGSVEGEFVDGDLCQSLAGYENNNKSWIFRSNWVTKLMEGPDYRKSSNIRLEDGTQATVANMMLPSCYLEAGRPMVFSEAQMHYLGLEERDLSLVELKCIQVNKDVSKQWTLLINYVSVPGMTKEVLVRQMALDALLAFNTEFTPSGLLNSAYSMYPTGIDLRSITFDSVMKMIMLNVTHNTSYIYGDTMQTIVEDSNIFTSILLLITAFICVFIIPLIRNFALGLVFFLGLWAIIHALFKDSRSKAKVSCGYLVSNVIFCVMTLAYYCAFKTIMAMTATDEVLSLTQIEINTGNPVWCLIFVLVISAIYVAGLYKMTMFCTKNYMDMGCEIYAGIAQMATSGIANSIDKIGSKITGADSVSSTKTKGRSGKKDDPIEVTSGDEGGFGGSGSGGSGSGSDGGSSRRKKSNTQSDTFETSSYTDGRYTDADSGSSSIDSKIKSGASNINLQDYKDIDAIDRAIKRETDSYHTYTKRTNEHKEKALQYSREGATSAAETTAGYAKEYRAKANQAASNVEALKKHRAQMEAENKRAQAQNERDINNI